jgi:hypothetical protein
MNIELEYNAKVLFMIGKILSITFVYQATIIINFGGNLDQIYMGAFFF